MLKIIDVRKQNSMTQRELSIKLGVTQASISRWEQDQLSINGRNLVKIAKCLNVSVDELLGVQKER